MILKCKNAFKEVGKENSPTITSFTRNVSQREQNKNTVPSVTGLLIKDLRGKNKSSDIQGLLAHAKKFAVSPLLRFLEKCFSYVVQDIFLHTHPPRLQDQTTSPLLPFPALPPALHPSRLSSTKHCCCAVTAEYSHIARALSHQGTFFQPHSRMTPTSCCSSSSTPPSCK